MEFRNKKVMRIESIKKKGFAISIIAFPVMLLAGFLMHPNLLKLEALQTVEQLVERFHNQPAYHIPPGSTPQIFEPGIISLDNRFETYPTFSPGGNEMFFTVVNASWSQGKILHSQKQNGNWSTTDTAIFSGNNYINWESLISPDGTRQFFASNRPPSSNMDIWMVERTSDSTWSDPVRLENPVNSNAEDGSACVVNNGTLYFKSRRSVGMGGSWLYRSPLTNGSYSQVESLGNLINTEPQETEPFMAPDESYLIFISNIRPGGCGGWDLWISYRISDSTWTEPINMGSDINTSDDEYGPRVSLSGDFLFFTRENIGLTMDIYWVSSGIIDSLKNIVLNTSHRSLEQSRSIMVFSVD